VEDEYRRDGLDKDLLGCGNVGAFRRLEIPVQSLGARQALQGINNVMNVRSPDIQLEWLIVFECD
jgi:hypothetical protein